MVKTVNGIKFYYELSQGETEEVTVLLHGWGASLETMRGIFNSLKENGKSVLMLDFPHFGKSPSPPRFFGILEYAAYTQQLFIKLGLKKINLIGHSFGGRIAILLAAKELFLPKEDKTIQKIVLVDAAGVKPKRGLKYYIKVFLYKIKKRIAKKKAVGSTDYNALPSDMKPVFVRVVNQHLDKLLIGIEVPTLIVWGGADNDTPLYMAKRLHKKIKNSGLVVLDEAAHYSFLDRPHQFNAIINSFL